MAIKGEMEAIKAVKERHQEELLSKKNVVGLGIGYKEIEGKRTGQPSLIVMVKEKVPASELKPEDIIPPKIEGVVTDVKEVGVIKALPL